MAIVLLSRALVACAFAAALTLPSPCLAETTPDNAEATSWHKKTRIDVEPSMENWIGAEAYRRVASLYSGVTWAPFTNLRQDGLRLRLVAGQSIYRYSGRRYDDASAMNVSRQFAGQGRFLDALAGWQASSGSTTVKIFGGLEMTTHVITPFDPETEVQGQARGYKGVLEIWHNWTPGLWTSVDLSAAQPHASYSGQVRTGWRTAPNWSLGPEISVIGHTETNLQRLGIFTRFENLAHEFTISGGASRARGDSPMAYGTVQYLRRF